MGDIKNLREEKANRIMDRIMELEKLHAHNNGPVPDKHLEEYRKLEQELLQYGYENLGNGYFGELD